jgi:N-carbamoyl-L-amino-acid hydrolase
MAAWCARSAEVKPDLDLAERFLARLAAETADAPGVTRDAYGVGEARAHAIAAELATAAGLAVTRDFAGNLYATVPGEDAPPLVSGSHLDSVRHGGNLDGAAGFAAALAVAAGLVRAGAKPPRSFIAMATRAEETVWFPVSFCGARAALGRLPAGALDLPRGDTGRSLATHMAECGAEPEAVRAGRTHLDPKQLRAFIEIHIEQGPVLTEAGRPIALVPAIAGGPRFRAARIQGAYAHVGAAPLPARRDAVAAFADIAHGVNELYRELFDAGRHAMATFGVVGTDPAMAAWSRVPGECRFTLDMRGTDLDGLTALRRRLADLVEEAEALWGVTVELGEDTGPQPGFLDAALHARMRAAAVSLGIDAHVMPSGSGHDALAFHHAGVPTGFMFVRSQGAGHTPDEAMDIADLEPACRILCQLAMTL